MKKENFLVIFYILYFAWLFTITYLNTNTALINYFTFFVAAFYLFFLKEEWDFLIFVFSGLIPVVQTILGFSKWEMDYSPELLSYMPLWLPIAWGTTVVALRKLYLSLANKN